MCDVEIKYICGGRILPEHEQRSKTAHCRLVEICTWAHRHIIIVLMCVWIRGFVTITHTERLPTLLIYNKMANRFVLLQPQNKFSDATTTICFKKKYEVIIMVLIPYT